jgi:hypothetical protein
MSFYHLPHPWNPGYAIPKYVLAEPLGRGTFTTKWLPRGTISQLSPDFLAKPAAGQPGELRRSYKAEPMGRKLLGRADVQLGSLGADTLGAGAAEIYNLEPLGRATRATGTIDVSRPGFAGDPIKAYGERASEWIMGTIDEVDRPDRKIALRGLLDGIDPTLWTTVEKRATKYKGKGMSAKRALKKALAVSMANGMVAELVKAGETGRLQKVSLMGLGVYEDAVPLAYYQALDVMEQLGFGLSDLNPVKHIKNALKAGVRGVSWGAGKAWSGARAVGRGAAYAGGKVWDGTKWVGGKAYAGAGSAVNWVGRGLSKLGSLACAVANSPVAGVAAGAGAVAMGAPPQVGVAGAQIAKGLCTSPNATPSATQTELNTPMATGKGLPGWVIPAGIGAVGLVAVLMLRK